MKHIPNLLTVCRFILVPFIVKAIMQFNFLSAFILLTLSGLTDVLDGIIARRFDVITNFGKLIDPLADKFTQISTLVALSYIEVIPSWLLIVLFCKEALMIAGASFLYGKKLVVSSRWYGKLSTVLFYVAVVTSFVLHYYHLPYRFDIYLYYLALGSTFFALTMYYIDFYRKGYVNKEELNANHMEVIPEKEKDEIEKRKS